MFDTSPDGIIKLIAGRESQYVEFKTKLPSDDIVARNMAAFANTDGGILILGVSDNGQLIGLLEEEVGIVMDRLTKIASSLLPRPIQVRAVDVRGKCLVFAVIEKTPDEFGLITTSRGELYQRKRDRIVSADVREIGISVLGTGITLKKVLKKVTRKVKVFVAMPFREEEEPALVDYFRAMERAVQSTKLPIEFVRIDLEEGDYEISQEIMDKIDECDIIISDFTLNARNVYFELGYARGRNKRIIQTTRKGTSLEFDIRNWRTIFYKNATELEEKLIPALEVAYADVTKGSS